MSYLYSLQELNENYLDYASENQRLAIGDVDKYGRFFEYTLEKINKIHAFGFGRQDLYLSIGNGPMQKMDSIRMILVPKDQPFINGSYLEKK